jgi:putrescine transport system ATP-binding protein
VIGQQLAMASPSSSPPSSNAYLQIDDVVKDFGGGAVAVNHVSVEIARGEIFALLGASGCGKTTLLRMLAGFENPTSGRIVLNGQDLARMPPYQRPINMMFQSYALFPHLTVWDNIAFGLRRDGLAKDKVAEKVEAMLKLVQLGKFGKRKPHQLSGGQQQRVALARSLAKQTQIELVNIIEQVGVTCVMVTHDQEEAMTMATRIAVMSEGRIMQVGAPSEIYETPATRYVADFIGNVNLMDGSLTADFPDHVVISCTDCTHYVGHGITGVEGMSVSVALRPEKLRLTRERPQESAEWAAGHNQVRGTVKDMSYFGSFTVYHLQLPSGQMLRVSESNTERHRDAPLTWKDSVWASWSPSAQVVLTA